MYVSVYVCVSVSVNRCECECTCVHVFLWVCAHVCVGACARVMYGGGVGVGGSPDGQKGISRVSRKKSRCGSVYIISMYIISIVRQDRVVPALKTQNTNSKIYS